MRISDWSSDVCSSDLEARQHGGTPEIASYLIEMGRDTLENWQSEFLQLLWQVVGLAYFLYVGSPASKENDDRLEAKVDELIRITGRDRADALIEEIRTEEHTSELQSLMRNSYAVFVLQKHKNTIYTQTSKT